MQAAIAMRVQMEVFNFRNTWSLIRRPNKTDLSEKSLLIM